MKGCTSTAQERNSNNTLPSQVHLVSQNIFFCAERNITHQQGLDKKNRGIMEKASSSASHQGGEAAASYQLCAALGLGVKHQMKWHTAVPLHQSAPRPAATPGQLNIT